MNTMRSIVFIILILSHFAAFTQPCSKEALLNVPGTWKKGLAGSIHNVSADNLAKERAVLAEIHKMFSPGYQPYGLNVSYANVFGYSEVEGKKWTADPYEYGCYFLDFICDHQNNDIRKMWVNPSTNTSVYIGVNRIPVGKDHLELYAAEYADDRHAPFSSIRSWPKQRDGYWYWLIRDSGYERSSLKTYQYLVTYDGKLPFKAFTRKEFLDYKIPLMKKALAERVKLAADIDPNFDAASKRALESATEMIDELKKRIADTEALFNSMSKEELAKGAIVTHESNEYFTGFKKEGELYAEILVKPDLSYYKALPKWVPQFFCISVGMSTSAEVFRRAIPAFEKQIDFSWFQKMLGSTAILPIGRSGTEQTKQSAATPPSQAIQKNERQ